MSFQALFRYVNDNNSEHKEASRKMFGLHRMFIVFKSSLQHVLLFYIKLDKKLYVLKNTFL